MLEKERVKLAEWIEHKHMFKRSEADVVNWLASEVAKMFDRNQSDTSDNAERIRIAKVKARAKIIKLKLLQI